ncbi:MAG: hypothetical protein Q9172_001445 [Xanthocarpia lactea]
MHWVGSPGPRHVAAYIALRRFENQLSPALLAYTRRIFGPDPDIEYVEWSRDSTSSNFSSATPVTFRPFQVPHRMILAQVSPYEVYMKIEMPHALADGQSTEVLLRDLCAVYSGTGFPPSSVPYGEYLSDAQPSFIPMDRGHESLSGLHTLNMKLNFDDGFLQDFCGTYGVTLANVCQLAWALVLKCFTRSDNVCFSYITSGRSAPLQGIQDAVGPFVATLPCRLNFDSVSRIEASLKMVCQDSSEGFSNRSTAALDDEASSEQSARQLGNTTMSFQRALDMEAFAGSAMEISVIEKSNPTDYDIQLGIEALQHRLSIDLNFWKSRMDQDHAQNVLGTFREAIYWVLQNPHGTILDVSLLSAEDKIQLQLWNHDIPKAKRVCLHEQFAEMARRQPNAPTIDAWDGKLTYRELFVQAATLTSCLSQDLAMQPESMVAVCMDKSKYAIIAMLAILQAVGVVVPLGVSHSLTRIEVILKDTAACVSRSGTGTPPGSIGKGAGATHYSQLGTGGSITSGDGGSMHFYHAGERGLGHLYIWKHRNSEGRGIEPY